ncbi:MAG: methyltransferase [Pseudomonadota bacterium]
MSGADEDALGELYARARAHEDRGEIDAARALFQQCLELDPADHCGVTMRLAGHGLASPAVAPPAYIATLFSQQADMFDEILVARLGYDVPALARRLVGTHTEGPLRMLDLGCGTGLAGLAFSDLCPDIIGVDLAEGILAHADAREVYGDLYIAEAVNFMAEWDEDPFDLIVAADVLPYLGDLAPFVAGAFGCLKPGGLLVASTEKGHRPWAVTSTQRFAHAADYVETTLASAGLRTLATEPITVRLEEGAPVAGDLFLARRDKPSR